MTDTLNLIKWLDHSIGFDSMINQFSQIESVSTNFPPYNILKKDDVTILEFALAGYGKDDISVNIDNNKLVVSGSKYPHATTDKDYTHRGIAFRSFSRSFVLAEHAVVDGATYENGLLTVKVKIVLPEEKKPRKIPIL